MAIPNSGSTTTASTAAVLPISRGPPPPWSRRARVATAGPDSGLGSTAANNAITTSVLPIAVPNTRRELFLGYKCYENARAHWFIFVPPITVPIIGKVIHVTGNPHIGFGFQIKLNYDSTLSLSSTTHFVYGHNLLLAILIIGIGGVYPLAQVPICWRNRARFDLIGFVANVVFAF
ncbi:hypothetical protein F5887DRAFT_372055 [Amanita rubescens]|nr:hypothetical protein F5887DRAFT_372055 [Amanita rubescens]